MPLTKIPKVPKTGPIEEPACKSKPILFIKKTNPIITMQKSINQ